VRFTSGKSGVKVKRATKRSQVHMGKVDYRLVVKVLKDWRVTIPAEIRAKIRVEVGDLLLAGYNEAQQITFTHLSIAPVGGTL